MFEYTQVDIAFDKALEAFFVSLHKDLNVDANKLCTVMDSKDLVNGMFDSVLCVVDLKGDDQ